MPRRIVYDSDEDDDAVGAGGGKRTTHDEEELGLRSARIKKPRFRFKSREERWKELEDQYSSVDDDEESIDEHERVKADWDAKLHTYRLKFPELYELQSWNTTCLQSYHVIKSRQS